MSASPVATRPRTRSEGSITFSVPSTSTGQPAGETSELPLSQFETISHVFQSSAAPATSSSSSTIPAFKPIPITIEGIDYAQDPIINDLKTFLRTSPTAWQATENIANKLLENGFEQLSEKMKWDLQPGGKYFVTRNGSTLSAFILPTTKPISATILGAHTDSPGLKLKPIPDIKKDNWTLLGTQIYGGPTLTSWFNRPLGLAGTCAYSDGDEIKMLSVNIDEPIAEIPQQAIHLSRELGTKSEINPQIDMNAVIGFDLSYEGPYAEYLIKKKYGVTPLPGAELFLVPLDPPFTWGPNNQMFSSPRLDNLLGCHASIIALLNQSKPSEEGVVKMLTFWDNEEVGSRSTQGAGGTFLDDVIERILMKGELSEEERQIFYRKSYLISNDVAHACHPNHPGKHDPNHKPLFGRGVVIKSNAQQCYATSAVSEGILQMLFAKAGIAHNPFVVPTGAPCGTTIGPIVSNKGLVVIDIGEVILSMHSPSETGNCQDHLTMCDALEGILQKSLPSVVE